MTGDSILVLQEPLNLIPVLSSKFTVHSTVSQNILIYVTLITGSFILDEPPEQFSANLIFGRFPHCNYNVELEMDVRMSLMGL